MLKKFIKAHYGKLGLGGFVASTYLFVWGVTSDPGPTMVATLILLGCLWTLCIGMAFAGMVEEFS